MTRFHDRAQEIAVLVPQAGIPGGALLHLKQGLAAHGLLMTLAAPTTGTCQATGGVHVTAEASLNDLDPDRLATLILLDGPEERLRDELAVARLIDALQREGRVVCAVGHGIASLGASGRYHGEAVAVEPGLADHLRRYGLVPLLEPVVTGQRCVTATEAGAFRLIEELVGFRHIPTGLHPPPV
jgi:putative intracellular protease/amidase